MNFRIYEFQKFQFRKNMKKTDGSRCSPNCARSVGALPRLRFLVYDRGVHGLAHRVGSGDSWIFVVTTGGFFMRGICFIQTTPGMAPNNLYAISNELFKKFIRIASVKVILHPFEVWRFFSFRRPEGNYSAIHKGIVK